MLDWTLLGCFFGCFLLFFLFFIKGLAPASWSFLTNSFRPARGSVPSASSFSKIL